MPKTPKVSKTPTLDKIERLRAVKISVNQDSRQVIFEWPDGRRIYVGPTYQDPDCLAVMSDLGALSIRPQASNSFEVRYEA